MSKYTRFFRWGSKVIPDRPRPIIAILPTYAEVVCLLKAYNIWQKQFPENTRAPLYIKKDHTLYQVSQSKEGASIAKELNSRGMGDFRNKDGAIYLYVDGKFSRVLSKVEIADLLARGHSPADVLMPGRVSLNSSTASGSTNYQPSLAQSMYASQMNPSANMPPPPPRAYRPAFNPEFALSGDARNYGAQPTS